MHANSKQITNNYINNTTCATSRMMHIVVLIDQSTEDLRIQRQFIAQKGIPKLMISDNGKIFKGRLLKNIMLSMESRDI